MYDDNYSTILPQIKMIKNSQSLADYPGTGRNVKLSNLMVAARGGLNESFDKKNAYGSALSLKSDRPAPDFIVNNHRKQSIT